MGCAVTGQKTILVTGASRGVGAQTARTLGSRGHRVVVTYREKRKRAEELAGEIVAAGGSAAVIGADLTVEREVCWLVDQVRASLGHLDGLVLNASGGLERGADIDYPMAINRDAQLRLLESTLPLLHPGARVVFVTSHQAHFVETCEVPVDYWPVAVSKRAGENAIRHRQPGLASVGIGLSVVSGDMIEGTMIVRLLERRNPAAVEARRDIAPLPTVDEFAATVADEALRADATTRTVFVGGSDYLVS